jgi:mono/diheme cytochrome c family protein
MTHCQLYRSLLPLVALAASAALAGQLPYTVQDGTRVDARTYAGWRTLRQFDCARCHGPDYQGSVGPSLIESVRARSREEFIRLVLEGNPVRGMPPYGEVERVRDNVEGIYGYFRGRADGAIGPGRLRPIR